MKRRIGNDAKGATAVEFAMILPFLIALVTMGIALTLAIWTENILQSAAQESARCIAIGSSACATVSAGCDSGSAAVCYVETVAVNRGMTSLSASQVAVNKTLSSGGVTFTAVTITYPFSLIGYSYTIVAYGSFPNAS